MVKILPPTQGTYIQSLGWEDPLQKEMATHSSYSCLENPMGRGVWQATVHGVAKSRTRLGTITHSFSSVHFSCSVVSDSLRAHGLQHSRTPCPSAAPRVYSLTSIESVMPSNHLILCHPLLLLPSIFPSIRVFLNESVLHIRWPKYWSFSFSIRLSNEIFRTDFL